MRIALYQPEIPQNTGTLMRVGSCLGVGIDIIEPCSFIFDDKRLRRAGLDYIDMADVRRHKNWHSFLEYYQGGRVILLDVKSRNNYLDMTYRGDDILLLGQESNGVPQEIFNQINLQVKIEMQQSQRSLNIAIAASLVLGEALRQTRFS